MRGVSFIKSSCQIDSTDFNQSEEDKIHQSGFSKINHRELKSKIGEVVNCPIKEDYRVAPKHSEVDYSWMPRIYGAFVYQKAFGFR